MDLDHKVSEDLVRTAVWAEDSLRYAREHDQPELAWLLGAVKADVELEGALFAVPSGERPARVRCSAGPEEAARHYVRSAADTADDLRRREREQEKGRARVAAWKLFMETERRELRLRQAGNSADCWANRSPVSRPQCWSGWPVRTGDRQRKGWWR